MNNKYLLAIFGALLLLYFASNLFSTKTDRSFKTELISVDTSAVTKIVLNTKADEQATVTLEKKDNGWQVSKGDQTVAATTGTVNSLLGQLVLVKTKRVAAKQTEKWAEYEVEADKSNRVQVFAGEKKLADFVVGRFSFNQTARTATTFIRLNEGPEVYAVDGFLSMSFGQGFNAYRPKELVQLRAEDITKISWQSNAQNQELIKVGEQWQSKDGLALDSTKVATYLTGLSNSSGRDFVDDFSAASIRPENIQRLTINANNLLSPIVVTAYQQEAEELPYVLTSSQNPDAYFSSKADGIYQSIFKPAADLQ